MTTSFLQRPSRFSSASATIASTDSSLALSMKPQVFTTMTSACSGSCTSRYPACARVPSITSLSTRFFGQPRVCM